MGKNRLKRLIICAIATISIMSTASIGASAEWRQTNSGDWWYADQYGGWLIDWQQIDGKDYYFYGENGLMAHDTTIKTQVGDFVMGSDGAWTHPSFDGGGFHNMPPLTYTVFNFNFETGAINKYKENAEEIIIPAEILGKKVKKLSNYSFYGNTNTKKVTITDGIEEIGEDVFQNCPNLEEVYIPDSMKYIGYWAFSNSPKAKFYVKSEKIKELLQGNTNIKENIIIIQK